MPLTSAHSAALALDIIEDHFGDVVQVLAETLRVYWAMSNHTHQRMSTRRARRVNELARINRVEPVHNCRQYSSVCWSEGCRRWQRQLAAQVIDAFLQSQRAFASFIGS